MSTTIQAAPSNTSEPRGIVALHLGAARPTPPRFEAASDWEESVALEDFHRVGGEETALSGLPVTPTRARIAYDAQNLYVAFSCSEPSPHAWAKATEKGAALSASDRVEVLVRPNWQSEKFWRFALARDGEFASRASKESGPIRIQDDGGVAPEKPAPALESAEFSARVAASEGGWAAHFTLPWSQIGGLPSGGFGLNLARFRQQSGEYLSPLVLDAAGFPPGQNPVPNSFLEADFAPNPGAVEAGTGLVTLPSGARFWNRPARLRWPSLATRRELWELQQKLSTSPTTADNFAARVDLAGRFIDVLSLEGFSFERSHNTWNPGAELADPRTARARINRLLRQNNAESEEKAALALDEFLRGLDEIARHWWNDGSPGNVRDALWTPFSGPLRIEPNGEEIRVSGADERAPTLLLTFPATGGVRLRAEGEAPPNGTIEVPANAPFEARTDADGTLRAQFAGGSVAVSQAGQIAVFDAQNREKWRLDLRDLRFRFEDGKILGVDWSQGLENGETVWGFGEWSHRFGLRGTILNLWQQDGYGSLNGGLINQSYKTIPLFHLSRGASVFLNSRARLRADIGGQNPDALRLTASGAVFDLFVWPDAPLDNLQSYARLTGTPWLPPRWALEPMAGGGHKRWEQGPLKNAVDEQIGVMQRFAALDIPHSALYAEGQSSNQPRLYDAMKTLGVRVMTWNRNQARAPEALPDAQLPYLRRPNGEVYRFEGGYIPVQFPYLDWTHPRAMEVWRQSWKKRLDLGVAGSMIDFGDWVPEDAVAFDGTRGDWLHNAYALDYHRASYEVFREKRGEDFLLFARQAAPGSQKYVAAFAGDYLTNFKGMRSSLRGALNFCSSGFSTWSVELGGFSGGAPDSETYVRWVAWSAFSPLMRAHGQTPREPWEYGLDATRIYRKMAWTRHNLLPAIHSYALEANRTGVPMLRALPLIYDAPRVQNVSDEYLFGPDLLVTPMMEPGISRAVTFPPGRWVGFWDGAEFSGDQTREVAAPLDEIPVFLREGALLPVELAPSLKWGDSMSDARVQALVVTPPRQRETRVWQRGETTLETSIAPTQAGFDLKLPEGGPEIVMIYGAQVARATFVGKNGRVLGSSTNFPRQNGRVVMRLPQGTREVKVVGTK